MTVVVVGVLTANPHVVATALTWIGAGSPSVAPVAAGTAAVATAKGAAIAAAATGAAAAATGAGTVSVAGATGAVVLTITATGEVVAVATGVGAVVAATAGASGVATAGAGAGVAAATAAAGIGAGAAAAATTAGTSTAFASSGLLAAIWGPSGLTLLGAEPHSSSAQHHATFDCWKPVVRDDSTKLSSGKLLKEIFEDQRVKEIIVGESRNSWNLPEISLVNIWDEQFDISYLVLPYNNQLVAHAVRVA